MSGRAPGVYPRLSERVTAAARAAVPLLAVVLLGSAALLFAAGDRGTALFVFLAAILVGIGLLPTAEGHR